MPETTQLLAVFIDFENLALGFRDKPDRFRISRVIARLVEKGHIVVKRAYADWKRFASYTHPLHEHAIELIEIPTRGLTGKNSADMRLCVDVMDLCYSKSHIDTFVILSGDSDFSPLVSKLKENGKRVIGLGVKKSTSDLLRDNCDEFIYYEDLEAEQRDVPVDLMSGLGKKEGEVYTLLLDSLKALRRQNRDVYWASLIKETMQRKMPLFSESYYGFKSFGELLQSAAKRGLVQLTRDSARRTHVVSAFGEDVTDDGQGDATGRQSLRSTGGRSGARGSGWSGGPASTTGRRGSRPAARGEDDDGGSSRGDEGGTGRPRSGPSRRRGSRGRVDRVDADRTELERAEAERAEYDRTEAERAEAERAEYDRTEADRAPYEGSGGDPDEYGGGQLDRADEGHAGGDRSRHVRSRPGRAGADLDPEDIDSDHVGVPIWRGDSDTSRASNDFDAGDREPAEPAGSDSADSAPANDDGPRPRRARGRRRPSPRSDAAGADRPADPVEPEPTPTAPKRTRAPSRRRARKTTPASDK